MHVREFRKPSAVSLKKQYQSGPKPTDIATVDMPYTYEDYLAEFVWSYAKWNTEESWGDAQIRIGEAVDAAGEGEPIKFEELPDWEKFHEANSKAEIKGPNAWKVRKMQIAGKNARAPEIKAKDAAVNGEARTAEA